MKLRDVVSWLLVTSAASAPCGAQSTAARSDAVPPSAAAEAPELPPLLERSWEVALARSAAPADVSADATVLVLARGGYVLAEEGGSGVTCIVDRSDPRALEPHCYDPEGSETILRIRLREAELREQGLSAQEIEADVNEGIRTGRLRLPARPAMSYMMSAGQVLYNEGQRVGAWKPHLMIYVPYLTASDLGLGGAPSTVAATVFEAGTALASIVIAVETFIEPKPAAEARGAAGRGRAVR
jgi:hypothetical protein